jgi:hypothetical protein
VHAEALSITFLIRTLDHEDSRLDTTLDSLRQLRGSSWKAVILGNEQMSVERRSLLTHDNPKIRYEVMGIGDVVGRETSDILGFIAPGCRVDEASLESVLLEFSKPSRHLVLAPRFGLSVNSLAPPMWNLGGCFLRRNSFVSAPHAVGFVSLPLDFMSVPTDSEKNATASVSPDESAVIDGILATLREKDSWLHETEDKLQECRARALATDLEINRLAAANLALNEANDALNKANDDLLAANQDLLRIISETPNRSPRFALLRCIVKRL